MEAPTTLDYSAPPPPRPARRGSPLVVVVRLLVTIPFAGYGLIALGLLLRGFVERPSAILVPEFWGVLAVGVLSVGIAVAALVLPAGGRKAGGRKRHVAAATAPADAFR